jgi:hypothetical protein
MPPIVARFEVESSGEEHAIGLQCPVQLILGDASLNARDAPVRAEVLARSCCHPFNRVLP